MIFPWHAIASVLLGVLFEFLAGFVRQLQRSGADDEPFLERIYLVVRGIEADHPDWSPDQKWEYAVTAARQVALDSGKTIRDALMNALIELAVVRLKDEKGT